MKRTSPGRPSCVTSSASSLLPLIEVRGALSPEACRRLDVGGGNVGRGSPGGLMFEDGSSVSLSPPTVATSSRTELEGLADRLRERTERDFLFSACRIDPWVVVTLGPGIRLVRYRAAFRGSAGMLVCRVGLSVRTRFGFLEHPAPRRATDVGDALVFSGSIWCEERFDGQGASFLMTVLRRDL